MFRTALTLSLISTSFAATYTVVVIPPPSGFTGVMMSGINNSGQVAGYGTIGGATQAFVGSPSGSTLIPLPSDAWITSQGVAINASGQVAGNIVGSNARAFIGTPAGSAVIPVSAVYAAGNGINDSAQVAGSITFPEPQAFIGTPSGSVLIPTPPGGGVVGGEAVNNLGQVAGFAIPAAVVLPLPFIGTASGSTLLPLPALWESGVGYAVNDAGQVAGFGANAANVDQAFIGTTAGCVAIALPKGATTATVGLGSLNSLGVVVGQSDAGGWIWDSTNGTRLLSTLVPSGWNVTNGISISNNGLILAQASYAGGASQYVELTTSTSTPAVTPAPSTLLLVLTGIALCWLWRITAGAASIVG
ncbi:MAG TPA: hypothetical protein VGG72_08005 [Bryobacteraceae bacterium]|jgi:hypothetical protein